MNAVDPHRHRLDPLLDGVPVAVVELTAQLTTSNPCQIAASINQKLGVGDVVVPSETMEKRCREISAAAAEHIHRQQQLDSVSIVAYNHFVSPSISICFSSSRTRDGPAVGGPHCVSASVTFQLQTA